jgi:hypothetical protein
MNQFTFEAKQKTFLIGFMILGLVCLGLTFVVDPMPHAPRFWSNYLHNTVFFTGVAFITLFVVAAFITAYAGWYTAMKRIWEAFTLFLVPGLILMIPIIAGIWGHFHHLYHWADETSVASDVILQGKSSFLNKSWYTFGTLIFVGAWIFFAWKLRQLSLEEDNGKAGDYSHHRKIRFYAATFMPIGAFTSAAVIWLWVMSVDAHWYSTMFAWYASASFFVSAMAITILMLIYLKGKGYYENISSEHFHDMGKYLFAFSIFWTYLWFSQYMLIWYSNNGEETIYFHTRINEYPVLFYGNLLINFVLPFFVLMRNSTKRKYGTLIFVCIMVLFGHWWDFFMMIKPGVLHTAHELAAHAEEAGHAAHHGGFTAGYTIPGLLELGTFLGFLAFFVYFVFSRMEKAALEPANDPYIGESLHHHV